MKRRWQFSSDGTVWTDCFPINGDAHRITQERDLDIGLIAFRKKLTSPLVFWNKKGVADYDWIRAFADDPDTRCQTLYVRLRYLCDGSWSEFYRGKFSAGSCRWDLRSCIVEVKPDTVDRYTCLLEAAKVKRNILQVGPVDASAINAPSIEWTACIFKVFTVTPPVYHTACSDGIVHTDPSSAPSGWWSAFGYPINPPNETLQIYWREYQVTECIDGTPSPPIGSGWTLLTDNCAINGTAKYIRQPLISFAFDVQAGTCDVDDNAIPPAVDCAQPWTQLTDCGVTIDGVEFPPYFVCYAPEPTDLNRSRTLESAAEYIIDQSGCDLDGVRSDFFEWDPVGDAPGYASGVNYITGDATQVNHLVILQKSDAIDPNASNPATIGEMTFLDLVTALRVMFRCYWDIDDDGYVRIEHWHYWQYAIGLDLTIDMDGKTIEPLVYDTVGGEIPRIERALWMEAQGRDFVGKDIVYSGPCVNTDDPKEWSPGKITTDIVYILNEPAAISRDGFVIMACSYDGSEYSAILDTGAISGNLITNAQLSWANLQRDFWTWDRYLSSGNMNGADSVFDGFLPTIEQERTSVTMCCDLLDFNPSEIVSTKLGAMLGTNAVIESTEIDIPANRLRLTLRYAY